MPPSHPVRLSAVFVLGALAALAGGCAKKPLPVVRADPGEVEYAGCWEVQRVGPTCFLGKAAEGRKLSFHPLRKADRYEVWVDGQVAGSADQKGPAGAILHLTVPAGASRLEVRAAAAGRTRAWELKIEDWPSRPEWLQRAWNLAAEGGQALGPTLALLDREIDRCKDEKIRLIALGLRAQAEPARANRSDRIAAFQRAIAAHKGAGYLRGEVNLAAQLAFELIQQHDFRGARSVLDGVALSKGGPAEAVQNVIYSKGLLAKRSGDFRTAIGEFEAAADLAGGIGLQVERQVAQQEEALMMSQLGRFRDSEALLDTLTKAQSLNLDPCSRALLQTNRGWTRYRGREAGDWQLNDPIAAFTEARQLYLENQQCTYQKRKAFNANLNLALALLQADRTEEARKVILETRQEAAGASPLEAMWWIDLQARLALKEQQAETALKLYRRLEREARTTLSPENQWRASFGKAQAFAALGRLEEAASSLAEAEDLVNLQLSRVPLGGGRESFSDQWSAGSRLYVEILLRTGQPEQALQIARRARGRVLVQLAESARLESLSASQRQERDAWLGTYWRLRNDIDQISAEGWQQPKNHAGPLQSDLASRLRDTQEALDRVLNTIGGAGPPLGAAPLRRPEPGELLLAFFPLSADQRWVAFCDDGRSVVARVFLMPTGSLDSPTTQSSLSDLLLEPFRDRILSAQRLILLPYGKLRTVDFQALPFGGGGNVLLTERPVIYGLDIPHRAPGRSPAEPKAVVVADSRGDLPEARQEGIDTQSSLRRLHPPWTVRLLQGENATAAAVRRAISGGVDLLHYAGHADFSGRGGWESQIPLASQSRLTLGDILTLPRQPDWVVLSGCETGASDETTQVESQGLAHAFLLGGSRAVIAATRKVNDRVAHELVLEVYRNMGSTPDLAILLQQAQRTLKSRGVSQREWASFRVFEP